MTRRERFESFMRTHQDRVYTLACRLLGRPADAQDVAQQVFLRAWDHFADLDGNERAPGWLKVTTTRICLNHLSRYRRRWSFFSELRRETDEGEGEDFAARVADPTAVRPGEDRREIVERALERLPEAQRVPIVLFHFEDMSYDDIAQHLGVSLSKVKTDIARGRDRLRIVLQTSLGMEGGLS